MVNYQKQIVCFANSRKPGGRCLAGKEWHQGSPGSWIRPISHRSTHGISATESQYADGKEPSLLEVISIPFQKHQPSSHQPENHLIDPQYYWSPQGKISWSDVFNWIDNPSVLWNTGDSSYAHINNRIQEGVHLNASLNLIHVKEVKILVGPKSQEYPERITRGKFTYNHTDYCLKITDPIIDNEYLSRNNGIYVIYNPVLCISVGDAYHGYYYKLIAAVLHQGRFP